MLLIIRDMMFADRRHFGEFLTSEEKISLRILTDRLNWLLSQGIITKADNPAHKQRRFIVLLIAVSPYFLSSHKWASGAVPTARSQKRAPPWPRGLSEADLSCGRN